MGPLDTLKVIQKRSVNCQLSPLENKDISQQKQTLTKHPQDLETAFESNSQRQSVESALKQIESAKTLEQWKNIIQIVETSGLVVEKLDDHTR